MQTAPIRQPFHRTYVVTYDMASLLQAFVWTPIRVPAEDDPIFKLFQAGLNEKLKQALPEARVHPIVMSDLRCQLWEEVGKISGNDGYVVVVTRYDVTEASRKASAIVKAEKCVLSINRLFNGNGDMMGYGPRPGFPTLGRQFEEIKKYVADKPVILMEDGSVTGGTIFFILDRLRELGVDVPIVIVGFSCSKADTALGHVYAGDPVIVHDVGDVIDWLPDHDLIPFTPNCGRVLGKRMSEGLMPALVDGGVTYAYPYILPFGRMTEWSSLSQISALEISRYCLDWSISLWEMIGEMNGRTITVGELAGICPRISIPIEVGRRPEMPSPRLGAAEFLKSVRKRIQ